MIGNNKLVTTPPKQRAQLTNMGNIASGISNTGDVKKMKPMEKFGGKLSGEYVIEGILGEGSYGKVQLAKEKGTKQQVAIKTIKKSKLETDVTLIRKRREMQIMSSVHHPNIIHVYDVFENREEMVLVMEYASGGDLLNYLKKFRMAEDEARRTFRQILTAVYYCHKYKICHRDLKLENILLDEKGNAKLSDFGLSRVFHDQQLLTTFCGSHMYACPEIVRELPYRGTQADCWSLGVILYTMVHGKMPFIDVNLVRLVKLICAGEYNEPNPSSASPLIKQMLTVSRERRATIEQICNHWWVNYGLQSCLDLAKELAIKYPVPLDKLLSLTPSMYYPVRNKETESSEGAVGCNRQMGNTDTVDGSDNVSPTRAITSADANTTHPKRKLETKLHQFCDNNAKNVAATEDETMNFQEILKSAREKFGNATHVGQMRLDLRKPPVPFNFRPRSLSGNDIPLSTAARKPMGLQARDAYPNAALSIPNAALSQPNAVLSKPNAALSKPIATLRIPNAALSQPNAALKKPIAEQRRYDQNESSKPVIVGFIEKIRKNNTTATSPADSVSRSVAPPQKKKTETKSQPATPPKAALSLQKSVAPPQKKATKTKIQPDSTTPPKADL